MPELPMSHAVPAWQAALEAETAEPSLRRIMLASLAVIAIGFGGFLGWACLAKLDNAVPANGTIIVESKRKTVSLADGGLLKALYVKEGEHVEAGQALLRLDEVQAQAQLGSLKVQSWTAIARIARLRAEQNDERDLDFSADLLAAAAADRAIAELVANERKVFQDRRAAYDGTLAVQRNKVQQASEQITALQAQLEANRQRLVFTEQELEGTNELFAKGFATKTKIYELKRNQAELRGNIGELTARRSAAQEAIGQAELELAATTKQRQQDISKDLQDAQSSAADFAEKLRGAEDTLAHRLVSAPDSGTVTDIKFFTPGSAIGPGQPILDIVPRNDRLLVEVAVRPEDIEHVHPEQKVNIRLTAYKQHKVPVLSGRLLYVSADRQQDVKGEPFFQARAAIDPAALDGIRGVALYPGMPAEVLIIGGERTAIDYFLSPITDGIRRSLHEE
jgi:HlyD family secretion protein